MKNVVCEHEKEHLAAAQRAKEGVLNASDVEHVCKIFRMLAEPNRMKIVLGLLNGDMCVYHLTKICDSTQSAVSHQLRILRDNNIVKAKRIGQSVEYSIADGHIREIIEAGIQHLACKGE
ncbi:MAG: helix-turn-helix transcriptional regulator [Clostridia bacterium]|nr:helix-turn-helix transcriptional regulator [Clostridia bacterium]